MLIIFKVNFNHSYLKCNTATLLSTEGGMYLSALLFIKSRALWYAFNDVLGSVAEHTSANLSHAS